MKVNTQSGSYEITVMHGGLSRVDEFFSLNRKVLIVTDYDVPGKLCQNRGGQVQGALHNRHSLGRAFKKP